MQQGYRDILAQYGLSADDTSTAVTNMEKDTSIYRYQYFVKDRQNIASSDDKGLENFSL